MHYNEYIVFVVALTCVALVPITFLVILYRGTKGKRGEHPPFALLKNCSVVKGRYFIILLNNDCKFCQ